MDIENHPSASTSKAMRQNRPQEDQSTDSVCRVCMGWASDSDLMVEIFDEQVCSMILAEVLTLVGAVELPMEDDRLPKWCCKGCLKALESAYKLRILCQESDRKLRHASLTDGTAVVVKEEVDEDMLILMDHEGMLDVEEAVVVKEEVVEDLFNLVDQDGMLNVEEGVVSESLQLPKLEIVDCIEEDEIQQMGDDVGEADGMKEDDGCADSDEVDEDQVEKMFIAVNKPNRRKKPLNPNVYDEVEAVGFKCCGCSYIFNTSEELKTHSKEVHADKKLSIQELKHNKQCDICYKVMANNVYVRIHQQKDKLNYRCKVCGDLFWSRKKVCLHYDRVHDPNPEGPLKVCCACREEFETGEQLKEHSVAVHLPEKPAPDPTRPYACNVCYRSFKSKTLLHAHEFRKLKDAKKHVCIQCGMAFRYPGELKDHEMTHTTGEKVFQCPKCPKAYSNRNAYRKHVASHEVPADKYKCEICGVTLKSLHGLRRHTVQHTGELPHRCPHCPATFAVHAGLNGHLFTHTDKKTLECPICSKQFKRPEEVRKHLKNIHHKQKPFACFFCPKEYARKDRRKQHMLKAHPKKLQSNPLPPIELFGNPWSMRQRTEEAILREQGMVE